MKELTKLIKQWGQGSPILSRQLLRLFLFIAVLTMGGTNCVWADDNVTVAWSQFLSTNANSTGVATGTAEEFVTVNNASNTTGTNGKQTIDDVDYARFTAISTPGYILCTFDVEDGHLFTPSALDVTLIGAGTTITATIEVSEDGENWNNFATNSSVTRIDKSESWTSINTGILTSITEAKKVYVKITPSSSSVSGKYAIIKSVTMTGEVVNDPSFVGTIKSGTAPNITWNFAGITAEMASSMTTLDPAWTYETFAKSPATTGAQYWSPAWCSGIQLGVKQKADAAKANVYLSENASKGFSLAGGAASMIVTIPAGANTLEVTSAVEPASNTSGVSFRLKGGETDVYVATVIAGSDVEIHRVGTTTGSISKVQTSYTEMQTYTVTYDLNGHGDAIAPATELTALPTPLPTPTAVGYSFGGWYTDNGLTVEANEGDAIYANTTLYAKWTAAQYEVKYKDQGNLSFSGDGGTAGFPTRHNYGTTTVLPTPTKTGYTFGGWFTTNDCSGVAITQIGATQITAGITLYAKWTNELICTTYNTSKSTRHELGTGQSIRVTFHNKSANDADQNYHNWTLYAVSSDGNTEYMALRADNWDNKNGESTPRAIQMDGSVVNWETFKADMKDGGDVVLDIANSGAKLYVHAITTANGHSYNYIAIPQSSAQTVEIYLTGEKCTISNIEFSDPVTAYSVTATAGANCASATMTNELDLTVADGTYVPSGERIKFTATGNDGTTFDGWKAGGNVMTTDNPSTLDVTYNADVEAVYSVIPTTHTITFNANGGKGTMDAQVVDDNVARALSANTFTGADAATNFVGWNTAADGSGTDYAPGANITLTEDATLYAQWFRFAPKGSQTKTMLEGNQITGYVFTFKATKHLDLTSGDFVVTSINPEVATATLRGVNEGKNTVSVDVRSVSAGTARVTVTFKGRQGTLYGEASPYETFTVTAPVVNVQDPVIKVGETTITETTAIETGQTVTLSAEEGATIGYVWAGAVQSLYTSAEDMIAAGGEYIKYTTSNTHTTSTSAVGDRYLYAFAVKQGKYSDVVMAHFTASKPDKTKIWDYSSALPSSSPDDGLYYKESTSGQNSQGIKMDAKGYAYFDKGNDTEAGVLTLVYGARNSGALSLGVYANTSNNETLEGSDLIGQTQVSATSGLTIESIEIPAEKQYLYIKRASGNEGVINKIIWTPAGSVQTVTASAINGNIDIMSEDYHVFSGVKLLTGTELTFTATAQDEDYELSEWTGAAASNPITNNKFTTSVGAENVVVGATFASTKQSSDLAVVGGMGTMNKVYGADDYTLVKGTDYTTSSNGAITYTTSNDKVATVNADGVIKFVGVGTATITLSQDADNTYLAGSIDFTVNVTAIEPTITHPSSLKHITGQVVRTELASNSDGAFTITSASNWSKVKSEIEGRTLVTTGVSEDNQRTSVTIKQAASGNYSEKTFTITLDCFPAPTVITEVLEVRGTSAVANGTFTNSTNTHDLKFTDNSQVSDGTEVSEKSELTGTVYRSPNANAITIVLNSTSAKEIVVGAKANSGAGAPLTSITVDDVVTPVASLTISGGITNKDKVYRLTISDLNINRGSVVTLNFSNALSFYYFEVTSKAEIYAPVITDNGDATGTMKSQSSGASYKYKAFAEKQSPSLTVDGTWTESSTGDITSLPTTNNTWYVYAVAVKSAKQSDIAEGIIKVETVPTLSCRITEGNVVAKTLAKNETAHITTIAKMNNQTVTDDYDYGYSSSETSNATVNDAGQITAVGTGAATITIKAYTKNAEKIDANVVATDQVVVVVTDASLISPSFTWNGDPTLGANGNQFDVNVGAKFSDKTPRAYKVTGEDEDTRYVDITAGYNIEYFSSNANATVDKNGAVTGVNVGTATIIAVFKPKGDYEGSYNGGIAEITANVRPIGTKSLTVVVANTPNKIDLSSKTLTYQSANPSSVKAGEVEVSSANYRVVYESNNWNVATVDENGLVTAHNVGKALISVAYIPTTTGAFADHKAFLHFYEIEVFDPTRFIVTEGYGYNGSAATVFPLTTVKDNNNYVTMTFGGWMGVDGKATEAPLYNDGRDKGDYWGGKSDAGKADAAGANPDYPYAITSKSGGNPTNEGINNYSPGSATQFSVPCRGAYIMFEPSVDGTITANLLQNGVLDQADFADARSGRLVYIVDEFGNVVTPTAYGMASDVRNWSIGDEAQDGNRLTEEIYLKAIKAFQLGESIPTEGPHKPGNVEEVIPYNQGYAVLRKGPSFYTFKVKAGKKYYVFGNGTKNGFYGFQFRKDEKFAPVTAEISTETKNGEEQYYSSITIGGRDLTMNQAASLYDGKAVEITQYDRNFTADVWQPLVLPYSMNDIQVKAIFGDDVDLLYVDDVEGTTLKLSHHFYKTIVAGKSCLIKPSKDVTSLATTGITKDGVAYPYVTFSNVAITGYSDYKRDSKKKEGYTWSASYDPQKINGGDYYVNTEGEFSPLAKGKTAKLKGCRGFLKVTDPALAKALNTFLSEVDKLLKGDVDSNGIVNMSDANMVINYYLGESPEGFNKDNADVDEDGEINMSDANGIVNIYLGVTNDNNE